CSEISLPSLAIRVGLVVTPSTMPQLAPFFNSSRLAVSKKNFICCLLLRCRRLRRGDHAILQDSNARDLNRYGGSDLHRPNARRSAGGDEIARLERHKLRHKGDYSTQGKNHIPHGAVLFDFPVEQRADAQVVE